MLLLIGCSRESETDADVASALSTTNAAAFGFESLASWVISSGTASLGAPRTQGQSGLQLAGPVNYTTITSQPLAMTAADIAPLTQPSAFVAIDMALPTQQPNPFWFGATQMFVSCPAQNVYNQYLGQIELTGRRLGVYQTYRFAVPSFVQQQLAGHDCANFSLTFVLNVPSSGTGVYRVDNLRFKTANDPTSTGTGASLALVALRTVSPPGSTPGTASFGEHRVQVPDSLHVAQGRSGTGQLTLQLAAGAGDSTTCTYTGADQGTSYRFASCSRGEQPGDLVIASAAILTIVAGDPTAGDTKVKAQLAIDPTGDELVSGLAPIPTFWGDSAADTAAISSAYFTQVSNHPQGGAQVTLPTPEIGKRAANPVRIRNRLDPNAPPLTPHDPPFDQYGDIGGSDLANAYWTLTGHLDGNAGPNNDNFTTSIDAKAEVHGQLLGFDQKILTGHVIYNSDSGIITATGRTGSSATGSVEIDVLDMSVGNASLDQSVTKQPLFNDSRGFDVPVLTFGIFSVNLGFNATVEVNFESTTSIDGLSFTLTPSAVASATVSANVDAVVASGGISGTVDLIDLQLPINASALWGVNTSPDVCQAVLDFNASASATVSVGAGSVNAHVTFGDCDFFGLCDTESWTIASWGALVSTTIPFVSIQDNAAVTVPFPGSVCNLPFNMAIDCGGDGQTVVPGLPIAFAGPAEDPAHDVTCTHQPCLALSTEIPCTQRSWSTGDPDDQIEVLPDDDATFSIAGVDSCPVAITFARPGPHTVTMTADNGHSTSHVSKVVSVVAPGGAAPFVSMLLPPQGCPIEFGPGQHVPLRAAALDPTGATPISVTWDQGPGTVSIGTRASTLWTDTPPDGSATIRVMATSPGGSSAATTVVDFDGVAK